MFSQVFAFVLVGINKCINLLKTFYLDETLGITLFDFVLFTVFISILIKVINFIKQIQEVESENEKERYQEWLKNNPSTPRRFRQ